MKVWGTWTGDRLPNVRIFVVVGNARARRVALELGLGCEPARGATASVTYDPGKPHVLVTISKKAARWGYRELAPIVAHEAWHCAQAWLELMDEDERPSEVTAYMVQTCFEAIWDGLEAERGRRD